MWLHGERCSQACRYCAAQPPENTRSCVSAQCGVGALGRYPIETLALCFANTCMLLT